VPTNVTNDAGVDGEVVLTAEDVAPSPTIQISASAGKFSNASVVNLHHVAVGIPQFYLGTAVQRLVDEIFGDFVSSLDTWISHAPVGRGPFSAFGQVQTGLLVTTKAVQAKVAQVSDAESYKFDWLQAIDSAFLGAGGFELGTNDPLPVRKQPRHAAGV
jgi:hypothetical protein